jgi:alpha-L-arabinofuranosidase
LPEATITVLAGEPVGTISPLLHGHFAEHLGRCCVEGLWVGAESSIPNDDGLRLDVMNALREVGAPILRWPGGCFADTYHWRDSIGPRDKRPRSLGESCGLRVVEDNGLGTHEFVRLCRMIGAEPYLAGNVGSGSAQEMMQWVEYCNSELDTTLARERAANGHPDPMRVRYWGVGNENWGCGGNYEAADYAKEFRRYTTALKMTDPSIEAVACGHTERDWNLRVVETLRNHLGLLNHLSVHRYYSAGHATTFTEAEYYRLMRAGEVVDDDIRHTDELLSYFEAGHSERVGIAFDEWGVWHPEASPGAGYSMPCTQRDAVAAAGVLDTFHRWCGRVSMANIAQVVNVLQCMIQTAEDRMWRTPTWHLFRAYTPHRGGECLRIDVECPTVEAEKLANVGRDPLPLLSATASAKEGHLAVSISNRHVSEPVEARIALRGAESAIGTRWTLAAAPSDANSAEEPDRVALVEKPVASAGGTISLTLPPCSVQTLVLRLGS